MELKAYRDEIKLKLTGGVLELELDDKALNAIIHSALRELQRYLCSTKLITIPYSKCIDMAKYKVNSVSRVYRADGFTSDDCSGSGVTDPMYASQWQLLSGTGNLYNFQDYAYNYASWNTLLQIRNTTSTDLLFRFDRDSEKLYINVASNLPTNITIEYVPRVTNVTEVTSDYWIDMLSRLSVALAKITVGRIRSRYTQTNALWAQDGEQLLAEGNSELAELREYLQANTQLVFPID